MVHTVVLSFSLIVVWLLLSGHFTAFLLGLGALSVAVVVRISLKMDTVDHESVPFELGFGILTYWAWLLMEIAKANIDVARRILSPRPDISPTLVKVRASQPSEVGRVIYANSITLTPGTVSVDLEGDEITVHALTKGAAEALGRGDMDRRVRRLERMR